MEPRPTLTCTLHGRTDGLTVEEKNQLKALLEPYSRGSARGVAPAAVPPRAVCLFFQRSILSTVS